MPGPIPADLLNLVVEIKDTEEFDASSLASFSSTYANNGSTIGVPLLPTQRKEELNEEATSINGKIEPCICEKVAESMVLENHMIQPLAWRCVFNCRAS